VSGRVFSEAQVNTAKISLTPSTETAASDPCEPTSQKPGGLPILTPELNKSEVLFLLGVVLTDSLQAALHEALDEKQDRSPIYPQ
jgi:hypothetical protein